MRLVVTLLAVAGNFAATVALMLSLSMATSVGIASPASAAPKECDPKHYFCLPCNPAVVDAPCARGCCGGPNLIIKHD